MKRTTVERRYKRCELCEQLLTSGFFYCSEGYEDGWSFWCKKCIQTNKSAWKRIKKKRVVPRYYRTPPEKRREKYLMRSYGLTIKDYERLLLSQKGVCAVCGIKENIRLLVDHDHKTGKVRGLLCNSCNVLLGVVEDSSEILRKGARYLEEMDA